MKSMSDQPTPKPPWERHRHHTTPVEEAIALAWVELYRTPAEKAWSELCTLRTRLAALERAVEAALCFLQPTGTLMCDENFELCEQLRAAIGAEKEVSGEAT